MRIDNWNRKKARFLFGVVAATTIAVILVLTIGLNWPSGRVVSAASSPYSYADNGLDCPVPPGTPSKVTLLLQKVVDTPQFLSVADGLPYFMNSYNSVSNRNVTYNGVTTFLPNATELNFLNYGDSKECSFQGVWSQSIIVDVPIQGNDYNVTGEQITLAGASR